MALEQGTTEAEIKASAEKIVGGKRIDVWTVGTTGNLDVRRERHGRPTIWHYWKSQSEDVSKNVAAYLQSKGMKTYTGDDAKTDKATFVYIAWI